MRSPTAARDLFSIWENFEALRNYVYKTAHAELLRGRREWFEAMTGVHLAMWWVPRGHIPSIDEAKKRLAYLETHGASQFAFDFQSFFAPDEEYIESFDWSIFTRCAMSGA